MPLYDGMVRALEDHLASRLRAENAAFRAALAAATERLEAAEAKNARACGCEWEDGSPRLHGADLDRMCPYHKGVEGRAAQLQDVAAALEHAHALREADRRERAAAIARADAIAARLREVEDREHPA